MLLKPRRLPSRFNRTPSPLTRRFVRRRHRRRTYSFERWRRLLTRVRRTSGSVRLGVRRFLLMFAAGVALLVFILLVFSPLIRVREIRVPRRDARIDVEQVQRALAPVFRRHLFFLPSQEVVGLLRDAVPDLTDVTVQKQYPSTLVVRLALDPVIARLSIQEPGRRDESASVPTGSGAAPAAPGDYLTAQGLYVQYGHGQVDGDALPLLWIVDWGARPAPQSQLVRPAFLLAISEAEKALREQFGQETLERTVFLRAQEVHLRTKNITLWFDLESTLEEQLNRYRIFLRTIGLAQAKEYVDLRLRDRVVYK